MRRIYWLAKDLFASRERPCSMELVHQLRLYIAYRVGWLVNDGVARMCEDVA